MMLICVPPHIRFFFKGTGLRLVLARARVSWYKFEILLYNIFAYYQRYDQIY